MFKFIDIPQQDLQKINEIAVQGLQSELKFGVHERDASTTLTFPHETYTVGLSSLLESLNPIPEKTGIRVIEALKTSFNSIIDINKSEKGDSHSQIFQDRNFVDDYELAFGNIMESGMEKENYAVRTLKIPALYVDALWLHDNMDESKDRYIAVRSMNLFETNQFYTKAEFFNILRNAAKNYDLDDELLGG